MCEWWVNVDDERRQQKKSKSFDFVNGRMFMIKLIFMTKIADGDLYSQEAKKIIFKWKRGQKN